ncbi:MAG TPA: tRNA (adenosine(37)-N6)-threonylcarbamoyltransferase complex ATPase subunit type 1 TsaE, partial [Burkholderiaceae bacterium]|nr:tRNA (adenosine(37)-N6)-threonylcarbamoyltransferase complex ATPase subunit type 1 TsaE [Burkholderiaceae bacterium]
MQHFSSHLNDEAGTLALGASLARALAPGLTIYL